MSTLLQDIRYGLRMLAKNPGFMAVAVLTLALGIGANTAIFTLINAAMLKALPVKNPERLVLLTWRSRKWPMNIEGFSSWGGCPAEGGMSKGCSFSYATFDEIRRQNQVLAGLFAFAGPALVNVGMNGQASFADADFVTGDFFSALGVRPALGRTLTPEDDRVEAAPAVVISHAYWERKFGLDPSVAGKSLTVNGVAFTLVGVAAPGFFGLQPGTSRDMWLPLATELRVTPRWNASFDGRIWWLWMMGRLKPGVRQEQARAALDVIFGQVVTGGAKPAFKPETNPRIELASAGRGLALLRLMFSKPLFILLAVTNLVLLVACANVANLMLARAAAREREIAVRTALGAPRLRLIRQLLTESLLMAAAGGTAGTLVAYWSSRMVVAFMSSAWFLPLSLDVRPELHVLAFTAAITLLTVILFGIVPACRTTLVDLTPALKTGVRSFSGTQLRRGRLGLRDVLVIGQVAMALPLLVGAGLFVRTLVNLQTLDPGFNPKSVLLFALDPALSGYTEERMANLYKELLARLGTLPGVASASLSSSALLSGRLHSSDIAIEGDTESSNKAINILHVGPQFFETMGIPRLLGRTIGREEMESKRKVAVINQMMARQFFAGQNPLGKHFGWTNEKGFDTEIVGVVGDAKYDELWKDIQPTVYLPFHAGSAYFELRTPGNASALIPAVRRAVDDLDRSLPLSDLRTQSEQIDQTLFLERLVARLSCIFGGLALVLACVGLYGVMSYSVLQKTKEIGIRMALGAKQSDVLGLVVGQGVILTLIGVALGLAGAFLLTRFLSSLLFGIRPTDPATFVAVSVLLTAVALLASYIPARRATKVDPMVALRYE